MTGTQSGHSPEVSEAGRRQLAPRRAGCQGCHLFWPWREPGEEGHVRPRGGPLSAIPSRGPSTVHGSRAVGAPSGLRGGDRHRKGDAEGSPQLAFLSHLGIGRDARQETTVLAGCRVREGGHRGLPSPRGGCSLRLWSSDWLEFLSQLRVSGSVPACPGCSVSGIWWL